MPLMPVSIGLTCSVVGLLLRRPASSLALSVFISTTMSLFTSPLALYRKTKKYVRNVKYLHCTTNGLKHVDCFFFFTFTLFLT